MVQFQKKKLHPLNLGWIDDVNNENPGGSCEGKLSDHHGREVDVPDTLEGHYGTGERVQFLESFLSTWSLCGEEKNRDILLFTNI